MRFSLFFLIFLLRVLPVFALEPDEGTPLNFERALYQAYFWGLSGEFDHSQAAFRQLREMYPEKVLIDALDARIFELKGDFAGAKAIFDQAFSKARAVGPMTEGGFQSLERSLKTKEEFQAAMFQAPSWSEAKVLDTGPVVVTTNIPDRYSWILAERITTRLEDIRLFLKNLLGDSSKSLPPLRVFLIGRYEDYAAAGMKIGEPQQPLVSEAYYDARKDTMIIYFNGETNWYRVVHELVRYLIRKLYLGKPSRLFEEGLAEFAALKFETTDVIMEFMRRQQFLNWGQEPKRWESVLSIFEHWERYERLIHQSEGVLLLSGENPRNYIQIRAELEDVQNYFHFMAWALFTLCLEGDPFFQSFLTDYLKYEIQNQSNDRSSAEAYFDSHLPAAEKGKINEQWKQFSSYLVSMMTQAA